MPLESMKAELGPSTAGLRYPQRPQTVARWSTLAAISAGTAAATSSAATGSPPFEQAEAVAYSLVTTAAVENVFVTGRSYAPMEASLAQLTMMQAGTDLALRSLSEQVADLRGRFDNSALTLQIEGYTPAFSKSEIEAALLYADKKDDAADVGELLDIAADQELQSKALLELAIKWLGSEVAFTRSAAARVLAANDRVKARELLPDLIEAEQNVTAKSILRAALRSLPT